MRTNELFIDEYVAAHIRALEAQKMPLMKRFRGEGERCAVPAVSAVIVGFIDILAAGAAVLPICRIPGVRDLNRLKAAEGCIPFVSILQHASVKIPICQLHGSDRPFSAIK